MSAPAFPSSVSNALTAAPDLSGLATFGKVAFAMAVILVVILASAWLVRRFGAHQHLGGRQLRVVAARAMGSKQKVVVVQVEDTWLVLGVGTGGVRRLHVMPAAPEAPPPPPPPPSGDDSFGHRFATALKQNLWKSRS